METVNSLYSQAADQAPQVMRPYLGNRLEQDNRIRRQGKHVQDRPLENPRHLFKCERGINQPDVIRRKLAWQWHRDIGLEKVDSGPLKFFRSEEHTSNIQPL